MLICQSGRYGEVQILDLPSTLNTTSQLAPIILGRCLHCQRMRMSLCYEFISSAGRNKRESQRDKQMAHGKRKQCTNNRITSTSELLLRQNSVTAHALRLASDRCATENHRPISAVRPIHCCHRHDSSVCRLGRLKAPRPSDQRERGKASL
jgi:hypothetical protein